MEIAIGLLLAALIVAAVIAAGNRIDLVRCRRELDCCRTSRQWHVDRAENAQREWLGYSLIASRQEKTIRELLGKQARWEECAETIFGALHANDPNEYVYPDDEEDDEPA